MNSEDIKTKILQALNEQTDGFIVPNQSAFSDIDTHSLFMAIYELIENDVLQRRDCEGLAYEYKIQENEHGKLTV